MTRAPCYHCPRRSTPCHDHCDEYKAWAADIYAAHRAGDATRDADAHTRITIDKAKRRNHR